MPRVKRATKGRRTRECLRISPLERSIRSRKVIDLAASLLTRCISILSACLRKLVSILAVADTDERRGDGGGGGGREREIARELPSNGDSKINHLVMPNKRIRPRESFYFREKIVVLSLEWMRQTFSEVKWQMSRETRFVESKSRVC